MTFTHRHGFAKPYALRAGRLLVFDGAAGSGKSTQLQRVREAQESPRDGTPLLRPDPLFVEMPHDLQSDASVERRAAALTALRSGRTVFTERWSYADVLPHLLLLSLASFTGAADRGEPWSVTPPDRVQVLPAGHEGIVGLALWDALAKRRLYAACACQLAA